MQVQKPMMTNNINKFLCNKSFETPSEGVMNYETPSKMFKEKH